MSDRLESFSHKKRGWPKGKKRKKLLKDGSIAKKPVTAYAVFMKQRRNSLLRENIGMSYSEISKIVDDEWSSMSSDQKSVFLDAAQKQKDNLIKDSFQHSDSSKKLTRSMQNSSSQNGSNSKLDSKRNSKTFDDPIFTESFLDYNKAKESELHQLNRTNGEYEQHNCILEGHIDNLKNAIIKLESETHMQTIKNKELESKLVYFRELLCLAFSRISLPSTKDLPTVFTIDKYLLEMCSILEKNNVEHIDFASAVYDAMTTVSFQSLDAYWDEHKHDLET